MFVAFIAVLALVSVPLAGGKLSALAGIRIRSTWLVVVALVVQVLITSVVPSWPHALLVALHLWSYALIGVVLWRNRALTGLPLIALGGFSNGLAIALNGGTLPASASALARAGMPVDPHFSNSGVLAHPILPWLGDIVATPSWLPFRNVISIGDLIALVGLAVLVHVVCGSRLVPQNAERTPGKHRSMPVRSNPCSRQFWSRVEGRSPAG